MHATKKTHVDSRLVRFRSRIFVAMNKLSGNSVRDESKNDSIAARSRLSGNCIVIVEQIDYGHFKRLIKMEISFKIPYSFLLQESYSAIYPQ